ncbi:MAG: cytochrome B, partial [Flavobacteriia bacterium]|nr:cytochrome B [Flavobacteriia bacterium]
MNALIHTHSGLRWVVLILLLAAIGRAFARKNGGLYEKSDKMINLFAMVSLHTQLLLGLILYFTSPKVTFIQGWMKVSQSRFYGMEHIAVMLIAIVLITIGRRKAENA